MERRDLVFDRAGARLHGTLSLPDGEGPWPGIVAIHGASDGQRDFRLFVHLESLVLPAGFAVLRYDRRGSGASEGDFASASLSLLATDALAAIRALADVPGVDRSTLGIYGFSQGGWIGAEAAARSDAIRFMALVGACAVTPAHQMRYAAATALRAAGYNESVVAQALAVRAAVDDAIRGKGDRAAAVRMVRAVRGEPWFASSFIADLADVNSPDDEKWRLEMDYDVGPILAQLTLPVLLIHGEHDRWTPIEESQAAWRNAYRSRPDSLTVIRVPGTGHFPTLANGREGEELAAISPDYTALMLRWLRTVTTA